MNYPFWEVPVIGGGLVIGIIAILHVFVSHFAVGGGLFLLENWHVVDFDRTWPVILLVIGGVKLLQSAASVEGHIPRVRLNRNVGGGPIPPTPPTPPSPPVPPTSSEVNTNEVNRG